MPSMKQGGDWISTNSAILRSGHYHLTVEEARRRDLVGEPLRMITLESRIPCARNLATLLRQSGLSQALDQPDTILLPREGHCHFVKMEMHAGGCKVNLLDLNRNRGSGLRKPQ